MKHLKNYCPEKLHIPAVGELLGSHCAVGDEQAQKAEAQEVAAGGILTAISGITAIDGQGIAGAQIDFESVVLLAVEQDGGLVFHPGIVCRAIELRQRGVDEGQQRAVVGGHYLRLRRVQVAVQVDGLHALQAVGVEHHRAVPDREQGLPFGSPAGRCAYEHLRIRVRKALAVVVRHGRVGRVVLDDVQLGSHQYKGVLIIQQHGVRAVGAVVALFELEGVAVLIGLQLLLQAQFGALNDEIIEFRSGALVGAAQEAGIIVRKHCLPFLI